VADAQGGYPVLARISSKGVPVSQTYLARRYRAISWSADGSKLFGTAMDVNGSTLYTIDWASGAEVAKVVFGGWPAGWTPAQALLPTAMTSTQDDPSALTFAAAGYSGLFSLAVSSGVVTQKRAGALSGFSSVTGLASSPDGDLVVSGTQSGTNVLARVHADGTSTRVGTTPAVGGIAESGGDLLLTTAPGTAGSIYSVSPVPVGYSADALSVTNIGSANRPPVGPTTSTQASGACNANGPGTPPAPDAGTVTPPAPKQLKVDPLKNQVIYNPFQTTRNAEWFTIPGFGVRGIGLDGGAPSDDGTIVVADEVVPADYNPYPADDPETRSNNQADVRWDFVPNGDGTFLIRNTATGKCIDVRWWDNVAEEWRCSDSIDSQRWRLAAILGTHGVPQWHLVHAKDGQCLQISRDLSYAGAWLDVTHCGAGDSQTWVIADNVSYFQGYVAPTVVNSELTKTASGAALQQCQISPNTCRFDETGQPQAAFLSTEECVSVVEYNDPNSTEATQYFNIDKATGWENAAGISVTVGLEAGVNFIATGIAKIEMTTSYEHTWSGSTSIQNGTYAPVSPGNYGWITAVRVYKTIVGQWIFDKGLDTEWTAPDEITLPVSPGTDGVAVKTMLVLHNEPTYPTGLACPAP